MELRKYTKNTTKTEYQSAEKESHLTSTKSKVEEIINKISPDEELVSIPNADIKSIINEIKNLKTKTENIHKGHRARLKSQFLNNGISALTDIQKLELLLFFAIPQKDTNPLAHALINDFGSLKEVMRANYDELVSVKGIKENSAMLISLVNSFTNYIHKPTNCEELLSSEACIEFSKSLFHAVNVEQFYVVCINKSGKAKKYVMVNSGTSDQVNVEICDITRIALENKVNRILICHNHPYGIAKPSDDDLQLTYKIICSCVLNNIEVVDHVIIGDNSELSFCEGQIMPSLIKYASKNMDLSEHDKLFLSSCGKDYFVNKYVDVEFDLKF